MKLNRNSWHARYIRDYVGGNLKNTLCGYFWQLVYALLWTLGMLTIILFFAISLTYGNYLLIVAIINWEIPTHNGDGFFITAVLLDVVLAIFIVTWCITYYSFHHDPKKPTILGKWLKAKKDKICPIIEWENK